MPVPPQDRPLASVREEAIDRLIVNYGHGKLSLEAFERRLDQALDAKSADGLVALTSDLELQTDKQYAQQKREEFGAQIAPAPHARRTSHMIHIFGGGNRGGAWTVPEEILMLNLFGGAELDFSNARFSSNVVHIRMLTLFGGAQFYVNENINTVSNLFCLFGGVDNRGPSNTDPSAPTIVIDGVCLFGGVDNRGPSNTDPSAPTIVIDGVCLFGGVAVKIKRTLKERWLAFADHVREAFGPLHHNY